MTRDERDLHGLVVHGSDHLSAYNIFAEAVNTYGYVGLVYGLPRHLFSEEMETWAEQRGVLVKAIEDVALGTASVYRTLERSLPERLPRADGAVLRQFRDLLARIGIELLVVLDVENRGHDMLVGRDDGAVSDGESGPAEPELGASHALKRTDRDDRRLDVLDRQRLAQQQAGGVVSLGQEHESAGHVADHPLRLQHAHRE